MLWSSYGCNSFNGVERVIPENQTLIGILEQTIRERERELISRKT